MYWNIESNHELYDPILVVGRWLVSVEHCSSCKHVLAPATAASTLWHSRGVPPPCFHVWLWPADSPLLPSTPHYYRVTTALVATLATLRARGCGAALVITPSSHHRRHQPAQGAFTQGALVLGHLLQPPCLCDSWQQMMSPSLLWVLLYTVSLWQRLSRPGGDRMDRPNYFSWGRT